MANRRFIDFPIAASVGDNDIVLIWQDGMNKQTTKGTLIQGAPTSLEGLTDVDIAGLINGQILQYNSTTGKWENVDRTDINLSELNDVSIVSPTNGQVLVYNSSTSKWENSSGGFVPYTGAVTTVDLGAQGLRAGYIRFDTSVVSVPDEQGLVYWDQSRSTAALIMNGVLQHIGQDTFFYVKNSTGSSIAKGTAVRFNGTDGASGHLLIAPFLANGTYPSNYFMGVTAETIANGSFGQVMHFGELDGINTSGYTAGALLYASTSVAGGFQTTAPVAPNNIVLIAAAVNSKNNGEIVVRPTYGSNINQDEGVKITSPTTGDLLQLQAGGLWENKTVAQVIGSAYVPSTRTITINGTTQDLSANRTYNVGTVTSVGLSSATSGVTIGSTPVTGSGTITIAIATASGSQNGLLSSTDWTTFNNKQNALTNPVTGTGTTNYLPKFTGTSTIGNSQIFDDGTFVGINTATWDLGSKLQINGLTTIVGGAEMLYLRNSTTSTMAGRIGTRTDGAMQIYSYQSGVGYKPIMLGVDATTTAAGNVLIGTTTDAGYKLDVNGTGRFTSNLYTSTALYINTTAAYGFRINSEGNNGFYNRGGSTVSHYPFLLENSSGALLFQVQGTGAATFSSSVTANARSFVQGAAGYLFDVQTTDANQPRLQVYVDDTNGVDLISGYNSTAKSLRFVTGNSPRMTITSGGNVLIGTTTDNGSRLQVNGSSSFSNQITGPSSAVTEGKFNFIGYNNAYGGITANTGFNTNYNAVSIYSNFNSTRNGQGNTSNPSWILDLGGSIPDPDSFGIFRSSAGSFTFTNLFKITSSGNVLVGTTTDIGQRLQVSGGYITQVDGGVRTFLGYDGSGSLIGTTTNHYFRFITNDTERMRITSSGNVGIGTTSPSGKLHLSSTGDTYLVMTGGASPFTMSFLVDASALRIFQGVGTTERMRITSSGNVLIGTTTDNGARLQVSGGATFSSSAGVPVSVTSSAATSTFVLDNTNANLWGGVYAVRVNGSDKNYFGTLGSLVGSTNYDATIWSTSGNGFRVYTNGVNSARLTITSGGNVGIGTSSPTDKLQMNGGKAIFATSNFNGTNAGGSVFVFSDDNNGGKIWAQKDGNQSWGYLALQPLGGNVLIGTTTDVGARLHVNGAVRTGAPSGGSAVDWRLGTARGGTITPNAIVRVEIGGVLVDLDARYV